MKSPMTKFVVSVPRSVNVHHWQDVDLSLMVLAHDLQRDGHHVVLVTDDFKMAKATEEHQLAVKSVLLRPSSNDFQPRRKESMPPNYVDWGDEFAAEMQYAISRRNEYDVQAKITWMVDSFSPVHQQNLSTFWFKRWSRRSICSMNCIE